MNRLHWPFLVKSMNGLHSVHYATVEKISGSMGGAAGATSDSSAVSAAVL